MIPDALLRAAIESTLVFVKKAIQEELIGQGHKATGKLIDTIEIRLQQTKDGYKGGIYMQDYSVYLDKGIKPDRVPYSGGRGGGGTSLYIEALQNWIATIKPGLAARERLSFAFAIAQKAKNEGHPTKNSFSFSRNGRRTEWSRFAIDNNIKKIEQLMNVGSFVATLVENFVTEYQKLLVS